MNFKNIIISSLSLLVIVLLGLNIRENQRVEKIDQKPLGIYYADDLCITNNITSETTKYNDVGFWLEIKERNDGTKYILAEGASPFGSMIFEITGETGDTIHTKDCVDIIKKRSKEEVKIAFTKENSETTLSGIFIKKPTIKGLISAN